MSEWETVKARRLLAALLRIGWRVKRQTGSHHDNEEIGPKMLARLAKVTGLKPEDL
jgi:hypothetical protein